MNMESITAEELRDKARALCNHLPEDELMSHPAWRAAARIDEAEARADKAEAKLAAIGRLCPTQFDDREQLLGAITRILRGQIPETEEHPA